MTPDRFRAIVEAYGSEPRRWPPAERVAAEAFARDDADAARLLAEAGRLDDLLFAHAVAAPSSLLRERILAAAPRPSTWSRARLWWSGVVLGLAGAAGVLAGSAAVAFVPPSDPLPSYSAGAIGGPEDDL